MHRVFVQEDWPPSWKSSYAYDLQEVYGMVWNRGYVYAYRNRRARTLQLLTEVLAPGARILDIAAAQGNFSLALAELGFHVTWNDLRAELADYVRLKHEFGRLEFAPGDAFHLQFPQPFDAVLITEVIEHVAHPDDFLQRAARLVRPGGYIVMTTPNGAYFRNPLPRFSDCPDPSIYEARQFQPDSDGHIFLLHVDEVERFADRADLQIDKLALFTNPLTNGHLKLNRLLGFVPHTVVDWFEYATQRLPPALARRALIQMGVRFQKPVLVYPESR